MAKNEMICSNCGYKGVVKKKAKGSFGMEIVLWCLFLVPGLIYSFWRITNKAFFCPGCNTADSMIPITTPRGQRLAAELKQA